VLKISPTSLNFGDKTDEGKTSKAKKVTITNESSKKSKLKVSINSEMTESPFAVSKECDKMLGPKGKCQVSVTFTAPMNTTPQSGELVIEDDGAAAPQMVPLSGTAK